MVRLGSESAGCKATLVSVRTPLQCAECGREADEIADGWKAYLSENETNDDRDVILFCPECDSREFGADDAS
jgi:Zn finger protein HypA/HybF involved in hydrogenase expression